MGVPSRTSASTPALDQTFDFQIILGKVRPFLRRPTEAHPLVLIIARLIAKNSATRTNFPPRRPTTHIYLTAKEKSPSYQTPVGLKPTWC
jgi:hypothetical protein